MPRALPLSPNDLSQQQRRHLAVLFCDLCQSTRLATVMEAEDFADLLSALRQLQQEVIARHGGMVVRMQGDGLLAVFGYPMAGEDDGRRATEAALDLHRQVAALGANIAPTLRETLALHSGIHAGLVLVGQGDVANGRLDLLGDAANVAARLSDLAQPGEILVSEGSLGPETSFFTFARRGAIRLAGRSEVVHVLNVLGRSDVPTRFEARLQRSRVPFFGRQAELAQLQRALANTATGTPRLVAVCAAPGMGKTRLVRQHLAHARAQGALVLQGYCESYLSAEPLQPFRQLMCGLFNVDERTPVALATERVTKVLTALDEALLPLLPALLPALCPAASAATEATGAKPSSRPFTSAVLRVLNRVASRDLLVIFVDDWQWADSASQLLLEHVLRLSGVRLLVLATTRGIDESATQFSGATVLQLGPLDMHAAAAAVSRMLPGTDPFLADEIMRHSGGNPLFMEELCHEAARAGAVATLQAPSASAWLDSLIESRISHLPAHLVEVIRTAAVIGTVVPTWLLQQLAGIGSNDHVLTELAALDLLFPAETPGQLRFKHGITREVVYKAVGLRQRRALHQLVAETLQQQAGDVGADDICELLAYHYGAAGRHAEAARFAEVAGNRALAASALDRAQLQFRFALDALDHLEPTPERAARWHGIAQRLGLVSVFDPAREQHPILLRAVQLARQQGQAASIARAELWLGYHHYSMGESRPAIEHGNQALEAALQLDDRPLAVQVQAALGQAHAAASTYPQALAMLDAAIAVKQQHATGSRPAVGTAYALACKGAVLGDQGHFDDALACLDEGMRVVHGAQHEVEGSVQCWRAGVLLWQGRWQEALVAANGARTVAQRVQSRYVHAMGTALAAYAAWHLGGGAPSAQRLVDATSWMMSGDRWLFISLNHGWLADIRVTQCDFAGVRHPAAMAMARARQRDHLGQAMAYRALALAAMQTQGPRAQRLPQHYLALADRVAELRQSPHERANNRWCQARVALAQGHRDDARRNADLALDTFEQLDMTWHARQVRALLDAPV